MSRTWDALKRAEEQGGRRAPGFGLDDRSAPAVWPLAASEEIEYQKVRVWLTNAAARGRRLQTVMVVGFRSGGGSTTTATFLASTLAQGKRHSVLIVDANFRTPALSTLFNVDNRGGLSGMLEERLTIDGDVFASTDRKNLCVLPTGPLSRYPVDAFEGGTVDSLITEMKKRFDFVVFDMAPLQFPDAYALAPKVDGIIMVVEAERTSIEEAQRGKAGLEAAGGFVLGVVLNRQREYTPALLRPLIKSA
jgi:capsular exopolysaccharide synthesis family protein